MKNVFSARLYYLLAGLLSLSACLPTNIPLPTAEDGTTSKGFADFTGVLTAKTVAANKIKVTWTPSSDPKVVAYNIYDVSNFFAPVLISTATGNTNNKVLTGLDPQKLYTIRVRAATIKNEEDTNIIEAKAITYGGITGAQVLTSSTVKVTYNDGSNAEEIHIYCKTNMDPAYVLRQTVSNVALLETTLSSLTPGLTYTCRAALYINEVTDDNTETVTFTPIGQATEIAFRSQPGSANAGAPFAPQPVIEIKDTNGNIVSAGPDSRVLITLSLAATSPTNGTIRGTNVSVQAVAGVATFSGLNMQESGLKIVTATKADTSSQANGSGPMTVDSQSFTISPGAVSPTLSSISASPTDGSVVANSSSTYTLTVTLSDQYGNKISGVRPQLSSSNSADTITQPSQNTSSVGVTTATISTPVAGLRNVKISSPAGLDSVFVPLTFIHGNATRLAFTIQPANAPAGAGNMSSIQVSIQDAQGNVVTTGATATSNVSLSIQNSGVQLIGTTTPAPPVQAVAGVATFSGLGIGTTGNAYRLTATSGSLQFGQSNQFNITAGVPTKIALTGPATVLSGACSGSITVQLRDSGNNPSNAPSTMTVNMTGTSIGAFYTSCSGSSISNSLSFSANSNTKTLYFKSARAEALTLTATDPSGVVTPASLSLAVTPSQVSFTGPSSVLAGRCSAVFTATTSGSNGIAGPVAANTAFRISGLTSSPGLFYINSGCTGLPVDTEAVTVAAGTSTTTLFFKGDKAESLSLSLLDPAEVIVGPAPLSFSVLASKLNFTGPTSVVSGICSQVLTLQLRDELGNPVVAPASKTLTINGIGANQGALYTAPGCGSVPLTSSLTIAQGQTSLPLYYSNNRSGVTNIFISDPESVVANKMTQSQTVSIAVSPSALALTPPTTSPVTTAKTNVCSGPFRIDAKDGQGNVTAAITPIVVTISGKGVAGDFYPDNTCATAISTLTLAAGDSTKNFYFLSYTPAALTLDVSDAAAVLTSANTSWTITAAPGWIGSAAGPRSWFEIGKYPVNARVDDPLGVYDLAFDSTKRYLYVADQQANRILKYDYENQLYVGWTGRFWNGGGIGITGSNINATLNAQCASVINGAVTPGWCVGGQTQGSDRWSTAVGAHDNPLDVAEGGGYIYVAETNSHSINRYDAATGSYAGWVGHINGTNRPSGSAPGLTNSCTSIPTNGVTPGWCVGGYPEDNGGWFGGFSQPRAVAYSATNGGSGTGSYILVADRTKISRFNAVTGAFMGWIGRVQTVTGMTSASDVTNTCSTTTQYSSTPGWCLNGEARQDDPWTQAGSFAYPSKIFIDDTNNKFYVVASGNGGWITEYNLQTGTRIRNIRSGTTGGVVALVNPYSILYDNGLFYLADWQRIVKMDTNGNIFGWIGKVSNNASMSGQPGCASLNPRDNTPGWCIGGTSLAGLDEGSFHETVALELDSHGKLLSGDYRTPWIKRWDLATGAYDGKLVQTSVSPKNWSTSTNFAARNGFDDRGMYSPQGEVQDGNYLYVAEYYGGRVKKIDVNTGETIGWIGGVTSVPTGGPSQCLSANSMSASPGWCLGAWFNPNYLWGRMIGTATDGILQSPISLTTDSTWLYVADQQRHSIHRFNKSTGVYGGWIGRIGTTTTGGDAGCNGANNIYTPGWCLGGAATGTNFDVGDGQMWNPRSILHLNGIIYVIDERYRIMAYSASTGAFQGWTGMIGVTPTGGGTGANCSGAANTMTQGWCKGGRANQLSWTAGQNPGGGFSTNWTNGLATDGTFLYVSNGAQSRVDKFSLQGVYQSSFRVRWDQFTNAWTSNPTTWGWENYGLQHIWVGNGFLYGTTGNISQVVVKYDLSTGNVVGWQGAIAPGNSPTAPAACAGAAGVTPTWCRGGGWTEGYTMGGFSGSTVGITGDANFVYVSDTDTHRVTRLPK